MTAIEMTESNMLSLMLSLRELATNAWVLGSHSQQIPIKLKDLSVPTERMFDWLMSRYLPFPHPTSKLIDPAGRFSRYC